MNFATSADRDHALPPSPFPGARDVDLANAKAGWDHAVRFTQTNGTWALAVSAAADPAPVR
jgi:hypothetical protein